MIAIRRFATRSAGDAPRRASGLPIVLCAALLAAVPVGAASAASLAVQVVDGQTGAPCPHAFVMVGSQEGVPFAGNWGWADGNGAILFLDPALSDPQTVTAAADGYGLTTLAEAALGGVVLPLFPTVLDSTLGGTRTRVEGVVNDMATVTNDGKLDVALILPAVQISDYALGDMLPFVAELEPAEFPVIGSVDLPTNTYLPEQVEYLFFYFSKSPYALEVPGGRATTFYSVAARVVILDLIAGAAAAIGGAEVLEIGVERAVPVNGPMTLDIDSDLSVAQELTVNLENIPPDASVLAVSAAVIEEGGRELAVGYDTRGEIPDLRRASYLLASRMPGGDLADAANAAVGICSDTSAAATYALGIVDRAVTSLPYTADLDSWFQVPQLTQGGRELTWQDPTQPGVSPSPTWTRSNLGLRASDPNDSTYVRTVDWRIFAPAGGGALTLPILPVAAPGPDGGLPHPAGTPEDDQLYWEFIAANPTAPLQTVLDDFLHGATHWVSCWIPIEFFSGVPAPPPAESPTLRLAAAPNPGHGPVRFSWARPLPSPGRLEVLTADGRRVGRLSIALNETTLHWDGRDAHGRVLPAGTYWAILSQGANRLGVQRLVRLRPVP